MTSIRRQQVPQTGYAPVDDSTWRPATGKEFTETPNGPRSDITIEEVREIARTAADAVSEKKGGDIELLDLTELTPIADVFVIATGTSQTHVRTLADSVRERMKEDVGRLPLRVEGSQDAEWLLMDYGDVVVHLFQAEQRDFYGLERLWGDANTVEYQAAVAED
ncbi:MAG: ribosome silencing factor [Acidimicrobiia bacterium]|nr:ribosome silencing factor [Acidimicrobiia bacterium]